MLLPAEKIYTKINESYVNVKEDEDGDEEEEIVSQIGTHENYQDT